MIAERGRGTLPALLLVTDQVGLQYVLPALRAGHQEGHGR